MAIRCLEIVLERVPGSIYVYHEIVHNRHVVERFENEGVTFVNQIEEVPVGSTLVFSAHGVSPAVRALAGTRQLRTIDSTCPLVAKVHSETVRFAALGYQIILIGHAGHDEILGTLGEAPDAVCLVQDEQDVDTLDFPADTKLAYLTQTTLSVDETKRIVERLKARFPQIEGPPSDDICYATQNRQVAVRELAEQSDLLLVVGSQNSSNSKRLREVATQYGTPSHLIDNEQQLAPEWFSHDQTVGLTAGASAPESSVQAVVTWLQERYQASVEQHGQDEPPRVFSLPPELESLKSIQATE